jgi:hypothetical protein
MFGCTSVALLDETEVADGFDPAENGMLYCRVHTMPMGRTFHAWYSLQELSRAC